jgi:hypothetical protein
MIIDASTLDRLEAQAREQGTVTLDAGTVRKLVAFARPALAEKPTFGPPEEVYSPGEGRYATFEGEPLVWGLGPFCRVQMYTNDDLGYGGLVLTKDQEGTVVQQLARLFVRRPELARELFAPDWAYAPDWAGYLAKNEDGRWFWYESKPEMTGGRYWCLHPDDGRSELAGNEWLGSWTTWALQTESPDDWRCSLATRPD